MSNHHLSFAMRFSNECIGLVRKHFGRRADDDGIPIPRGFVEEFERIFSGPDFYEPIAMTALCQEAQALAERDAKAILSRDPAMLRTVAAVLVEVAGQLETKKEVRA